MCMWSKKEKWKKNRQKECQIISQAKLWSVEEEKEAKGISIHIPYGVVVEILSRLPPKSLMRCRCVCKDWCSLISRNTFIANHTKRALSQSCDNQGSNVVLLYYRKPFYVPADDLTGNRSLFGLVSDDASFGYTENLINLDWPCNPFPSPFLCEIPRRVLAFFNGLLCLAESGLLMLWNPSVRRALSLPESKIPLQKFLDPYDGLYLGLYVNSFGLGYDASSNDIRLVRLVYLEWYDNKIPPLVEIFSLNSCCWGDITATGPSYMVKRNSLFVFLNGSSHWIAHTSPDEHSFRNVIVSFDMKDEVFREIAVPNCLIGNSPLNMTLAVRDGLLCLVPYYPERKEQFFPVWIMKEYGVGEPWTKLFDIRINQELEMVLGFRKNGEVLVTDGNNELLSYEPSTQQITHLGFNPQEDWYFRSTSYEDTRYFWEKCTETIVLLNMKEPVSEALTNTSDN